MSSSSDSSQGGANRLLRPVQILVVSSVMFTFISYWRTAAVVLCDLSSTAYYIGGIVENSIGAAAPWFILAVMLFSYAVRSVYIESCVLFVRGGVYRVVKEAMGGFLAKLSVSALMYDFILTGPTSSVCAGQYVMGLLLETLTLINPHLQVSPEAVDYIRRSGAVTIACFITFYFFHQNLLGIRASSDKALKIVIATTVVAVVLLGWSVLTLAVRGKVNSVPMTPDLQPKLEYQTQAVKEPQTGLEKTAWKLGPDGQRIGKPKINEVTGRQEDPLGFVGRFWPDLADRIRQPGSWLSLLGVLGLLLAFGHSILAMSGEETLAQVYREVESPKLPNFKKAAFIIFVYSLGLTGSVSFLAVLLIPEAARVTHYSDNLLGGLAMHVIGPPLARLILNAFVVLVGFLILAGGVNTSIIGSNGVLHRVSEDGVLPDWFLKPHRRYGTTHRVLSLIVGLQLLVILASRGNMYVLGEAYAFGLVWSFAFNALAMVMLRFQDRTPRDFRVPLNIRIRGVEVPVGLSIICLILLSTAVLNTLTKEVATLGGSLFTLAFLIIFVASEHYHKKRRGTAGYQHLEQFNQKSTEEISAEALGMDKRYRKLVAIRSTQNLFMLEKTLDETDPDTTSVAVMTAQVALRGDLASGGPDLDQYNRELMTAVVNRAERSGKQVQPLIVGTNNPLFAVVQTAKKLRVQELVLGASNAFTADTQMEQIAFYWISIHEGQPEPLTVRILSCNRDLHFDLAGGNRIPKIGERKARSIAELRSAGVGVNHVLMAHFGTSDSTDLFVAALTMLDPLVVMTVVSAPEKPLHESEIDWLQQDLARARQLNREVEVAALPEGDPTEQLLNLVRELKCDLLLLGATRENLADNGAVINYQTLLRDSPCSVCLVVPPEIPQDVDK